MIKIGFFWTELSGYVNACLKSLAQHHQVELSVTRIANKGPNKHPYAEMMFDWMSDLHTLPNGSQQVADSLLARAKEFRPHVVVVSGWAIPAYRQLARELKRQSVYVIGTADNPWHGSVRQRIGTLISPWYLHPMFDALWVPGERGVNFAHRLGFKGRKLMVGLYSADRDRFARIGLSRHESTSTNWPKRFLFAGRFSEDKGIPDLVEAYRRYRSSTENPWELWVAGSGKLENLLRNEAGIRCLGFVQPDEYDELLKQVGVFILASHDDPWPLVIHEMTSAGLPIICSRQCGSSVELVQDGYNGLLFEAGDVGALTDLLCYMSSGKVDLAAMSKRSSHLSARYSPKQWSDYLVNHVRRYANIDG